MGNISHFIFLLFLTYMTNVISIDHNTLLGNFSLFKDFMTKYNKSYANNTHEVQKRYGIFMHNIQYAQQLNSQRKDDISAYYGITKFSDLTPKEFRDQYLSGYVSDSFPHNTTHAHRRKRHAENMTYHNMNEIPREVDWRKKGIITGIRNQGHCGACWAISAVEVIESAYANKTGNLLDFSVQEMIDCSYSYKNLAGCAGGLPCTAFDWLKKTQTTLVPDSVYPLKKKNQLCKIVPETSKGVRVKDFNCNSFGKEEQLMLDHIATMGTLSVGVDASSWFNYQGGIIQYHCPSHLNHAVQIVGYSLNGPVPYYIVKNSWGSDWGINGYLYLKFGVNICGVANEVSWVTDIEPVLR